MSFSLLVVSSLVRAPFLLVRFATALRSLALGVARLAMASIVSCWSVACSSAKKPNAAGVMPNVSLYYWLAVAKSKLTWGHGLYAVGWRFKSLRSSENMPV
jgi:hypothetical protein